jgi:3',5'-cyclic AMP phosphodiesterase CpdA
MPSANSAEPSLLAVSDLHVRYPDNQAIVQAIWPRSPSDWLIIAGDLGEMAADVKWALRLLSERFATVVWVPGNHELWTLPSDPVGLRGEERYKHLVSFCRDIGVITPEDRYPIWTGPGGPAVVVPLFLLYDYTFLPPGVKTSAEALACAYDVGVVCSDEAVLKPDPYGSHDAWCRARVAVTQRRLAELDPNLPTILVNHFPLIQDPTRVLSYPEFSLWCGTTSTADWHLRFRATAVVYGHLHIPRTTWHDGVRFEEVSLGYPSEWQQRDSAPLVPRQILPAVGA